MRILITGGQGYIARNLVPLFLNAGYEVNAPSRIEMDLLNPERVEEYLTKSKPDVIIHAAVKGGDRDRKDTWEDVFVPNMKMFENLYLCVMRPDFEFCKFIVISSGAEFDRRYPIHGRFEGTAKYCWPVDPYGLSKNLITRRCHEDLDNIWVVRLFGCFNFDEDPSRFIKNGILNLKRGLPIEIHQNKKMDYFYLDDIFTVIDFILNHPENIPKDINLVYPEKKTLLDIASLIHKHMNVFHPTIKLNEMGEGYDYTGSGYFLDRMRKVGNLQLLGLEEGIRRTVLKLT
jgi:GDP-L-fucose synthase